MAIMQWCKMQIVCLLVLAMIGAIYIREGSALNRVTKQKQCNRYYDLLFILAEIAVLFDGITACTVNFADLVPTRVNLLLHFGMYASYELYMAMLFFYWISVTVGISRRKKKRFLLLYILPCLLFLALTVWFMPETKFVPGVYTNYSMGKAVYCCFACIVVYAALTLGVVSARIRCIPKEKRAGLLVTLLCVLVVLALQIRFPEILVSSIAAVAVTVGIYITMENPSIKSITHYHREMVMGFATLVESKDDNTGGHIRRSSEYAVLIAEHLRKTDRFRDIVTRDYIDTLRQAAPMHDVGKVGIPDAILQKPGRLTPEEFEIMKGHAAIGGRIIRDTFGHLGNAEYKEMAFEIARHHHEKWNGKGYPDGLSELQIPLCARIMAVADVFDAVSAKRCYRDAMPLEQCFAIIEKGRGTDFDPVIADAFLQDREQVEAIYRASFQNAN